jgi:NAD(P)-dependent dehydrogenase (short-subunit alcohol dehydrogenase family)
MTQSIREMNLSAGRPVVNILVTGTSSGFGERIVRTLADDGHTVFATMRGVGDRNARAAEALARWAETNGLDVHVLELDVTDDTSVVVSVEEALRIGGHLDVVVNNAGMYTGGITEAFTVEDMKALFEINCFGPARVNRAVLPSMRRRGSGLLILVSSMLGRVVIPFTGVYGASKAAAEHLAHAWRYDLAQLGIDSVIVEPGAYPTPIHGKKLPLHGHEKVTEYGQVADRFRGMSARFMAAMDSPDAGDPQEVAEAVKKLIETPAGQRPLRTIVGPVGEGVTAINRTVDEVHDQLLPAIGLADLASVSGD